MEQRATGCRAGGFVLIVEGCLEVGNDEVIADMAERPECNDPRAGKRIARETRQDSRRPLAIALARFAQCKGSRGPPSRIVVLCQRQDRGLDRLEWLTELEKRRGRCGPYAEHGIVQFACQRRDRFLGPEIGKR
jgi:hypothetical protein